MTTESPPQLTVAIATTPSSGLSLAHETRLMRESLLYADRIVLYSPVATMLSAVAQLSGADDMTLLELIKQLMASPRYSETGSLDPLQVTDAAARVAGGRTAVPRSSAEIEAIERMQRLMQTKPRDAKVRMLVRQMREQFEPAREQLAETVESMLNDAGAGDMAAAVEAGILEVHPLGLDEEADTSDMMESWLDQLTSLLTKSDAFPLLDPESSNLVRAMVREGHISPSALSIQRGTEATTATSLFGYVPAFPDLPVDELLALRSSMRVPMVRFRAAVAEMANKFSADHLDEHLQQELAHEWLVTVEPALEDVREALAEAGLLRTSASVAGRDVRSLVLEAGGALAVGFAGWTDLSAWIATAGALALPTAHIGAASLLESANRRKQAIKNKFYLLHAVHEQTTG